MNSFLINPNRKFIRIGPVWVPQRKRRRKMLRQWWNNWRKEVEATKIVSIKTNMCRDTGFQFTETELQKQDGLYETYVEMFFGASINPRGDGIILKSE